MRFHLAGGVLAAVAMVGAGCGGDTEKTIETKVVFAECGPGAPAGVCEAGETCFEGECVASESLCSPTNDEGRCAPGTTCFEGGCVLESALCSDSNPIGPCSTGNTCLEGECVATNELCSSANPTGLCEAGKTCREGICSTGGGVTPEACAEQIYTDQPVIGVRTEVTAEASGVITVNTPAAGDTVTIGAIGNERSPLPLEAGAVFTAVAASPAGDAEFAIGATSADTAANLAAAINANAIASKLVKATVVEGNKVSLVAVPKGALGNGIGLAGKAGSFTIPVSSLAGGVGTGKGIVSADGKQFRDASGNGQLEPYEDWRIHPLCRARDLAGRMTVPEKVALMSEGSTLGGGTADGSITGGAYANLKYNNIRQALFRFGTRSGAEMALSINNMQELAEALPLGIPVVITGDPTHALRLSTNAASRAQTLNTGVFSLWPTPLGLGAANDAELTKLHGDTVRREFMAAGLRWQLGPQIDVVTEPRWERVQANFGENPLLVAKHARAMVIGFQGSENGDLRNGIAATVKHFPGAGSNEEGKDSHRYPGRYAAHPGRFLDAHLLPFQAAFDVRAASIMACYSIFKDYPELDPVGVPSGFAPKIITGLAKEQMGFDGMVTGDWGTAGGSAYGAMQNMSTAERGAAWVKAGSHQFGSDSQVAFQLAYDQGLLTEAEISGAAEKILEMTFKLGLFENPYVDVEAATEIVKGEKASIDGFDAQKRAIVLLRNQGNVLPLRTQNDTNGDGVLQVYYDGVTDALHGQDALSNFIDDYDYRVDGEIQHTADLAQADVAVARIVSRKGTYFGLDAGVPLSFDAPFPGTQADTNAAAAIADRDRVIDLFRARDGYTKSDGTVVAPVNPKLKIVLVMNMDRAGIVKPFINGLRTLDEAAGQPGSYPMVSVEANINPAIVTQTTAGAHAGVDVFVVDFGAYDRAILDFVFNKNIPEGVARHGLARLPVEIPSSDAEVAAQYEDVPADTKNPTYQMGAGITL